jgi:hypothetical protein
MTDIDPAVEWAAYESPDGEQVVGGGVRPPTPNTPRVYRPLRDAIGGFISEAQGDRIYLGLQPFDTEMRGVSPGHLCNIVGRTHSGKTLLLTHILRYNRTKRIILHSPDETATLILAKLAAMTHNVSSKDLERQVAEYDKRAIDLLHQTIDQFPNLVVFDRRLTNREQEIGIQEAQDAWGEKVEILAFDFMKLMEGETFDQKFQAIKSIGRDHMVPTFALHQVSRTRGADGQEINLESGEFGGEDYATFQLGVWRKKFGTLAQIKDLEQKLHTATGDKRISMEYDLNYLRHQLDIQEYTVTVNLTKNKRPGGDQVAETDFELDRKTGRLYHLNGDLPTPFRQEEF